MNVTIGLCYDDVLLIPKYSGITHRSDVDLSVNLGKKIKLRLPVCSSNMLHVTETNMAVRLNALGGLPILHRFKNHDEIIKMFQTSENDSDTYYADNLPLCIGASVGVQIEDRTLVDRLYENRCKIICVDVAHGHHMNCANMVEWIAKRYPDILLIAGNVATAAGALLLYNAGADIIKTNVGSGSTCSTRIETGNGVPSLTALESVFEASCNGSIDYRKFKIIADGGIRRASDLCLALCFSDVVMLGNLLAGTDEAPGDIVQINGVNCKKYAGSSTLKENHVEGVSGYVPLRGPISKIIDKLMQGLRSCCSYQGVNNLTDLKRDPKFVSISNAGLIESHPHDIMLKG